MNIFLFLYFSFLSFIGLAQIDETQANTLNEAFGKNYDVATWNAPLILHLDCLPEQQFPAEFKEIPHLIAIDLMPQHFSSSTADTKDLKETLLKNERRLKKAPKFAADNNVELEQFKVWLNGYEYSVIKPIGCGCEGRVYKIIQTATEKRFALKVYTGPGRPFLHKTDANKRGVWKSEKLIERDLLVLAMARASQPYLAMPLLVNIKNSYVIYPLLTPYINHLNNHNEELEQFRQKKLDPSLDQDGLTLGDHKPENHMLSDDHNGTSEIIRIDLGSLKKKHN